MGIGEALGKAAGGVAEFAKKAMAAGSKDEVIFNAFLGILSKKGYPVVRSVSRENRHEAVLGPPKPDVDWERLTLTLARPRQLQPTVAGVAIPLGGLVRLDAKLVVQLKGTGGFLGLFKPTRQATFVIIADSYVDENLKITDQKGLEGILSENLKRVGL